MSRQTDRALRTDQAARLVWIICANGRQMSGESRAETMDEDSAARRSDVFALVRAALGGPGGRAFERGFGERRIRFPLVVRLPSGEPVAAVAWALREAHRFLVSALDIERCRLQSEAARLARAIEHLGPPDLEDDRHGTH